MTTVNTCCRFIRNTFPTFWTFNHCHITSLLSINIYYAEQRAKELAEQEEQKVKELAKQYEKNLNTIVYKMLNGAADAESCGNKIKKVWSNTIWEDDDPETDKYTKTNGVFNEDFNTSLTALFTLFVLHYVY